MNFIKSKKSNSRRLVNILIMMTLAAQICAIFSDKIPKADYLIIFSAAIIYIINYQYIVKRAFECAVAIIFILVVGTIISSVLGIPNDNYTVAIGFGINCSIFLSMFYSNKLVLGKKDIVKFFGFLNVIGICSCIYNLLINFSSMRSLTGVGYAYGVQYSSFYTGRNAFAFFLCLFLVAGVYLLIETKSKIYVLSIGLFLINIVMSFSRNGILFVAIFIVIFSFCYSKDSLRKKIFILAMGVLAIYVIYKIYVMNMDVINNYLIRKDYGSSYRNEYWKIAVKNFFNNPIVGFGPGSATNMLATLGRNGANSFHNTYIEILIWGGLMLLFLYGAIMHKVVVSIRSIKYKDTNFYNIYIAFIVAILFYCIFETNMFFSLGAGAQLLTIMLLVIPGVYSRGLKYTCLLEETNYDFNNRSCI